MNSKLKTSALLSITALLAISVIAITETPVAEAKKDNDDDKKKIKKYFKGKPDFIAKINTPSDPEHYNGEKGIALFWVKGTGDEMKIFYIIKLHKIGIGEIGEDGTGQEPDKNKNEHYLWKLHVHPAPDGVHDATVHHFNIVGPADDADLKIKGKTLLGKWDITDFENRKDLPHDHHETTAPNLVIDQMCASDTDVNVHLEHASHLEVRGQIIPTSDFCDSLS